MQGENDLGGTDLRWLALILVVLNLALFSWFQQEQGMRDRLASRTEFSGLEVGSLKLLAEVPIRLRQRNNPGASSESMTTQKVCHYLIGFDTEGDAQGFSRRWLPALAAPVRMRDPAAPSYWVYVRTPDDLQDKQHLGLELRDSGLEVSPITEGELKGQLSLGRYQSKDLAQALFFSLKQQGYPAELFQSDVVAGGFEIELDDNALDALGPEWLAGVSAEDSRVKIEKKSCKKLASAEVHE